MEFSVKFDKMRGHLLERVECYRIDRSRIAMDAEDELVKFMTKKFQEQRIAKLRELQERLRVKVLEKYAEYSLYADVSARVHLQSEDGEADGGQA